MTRLARKFPIPERVMGRLVELILLIERRCRIHAVALQTAGPAGVA